MPKGHKGQGKEKDRRKGAEAPAKKAAGKKRKPQKGKHREQQGPKGRAGRQDGAPGAVDPAVAEGAPAAPVSGSSEGGPSAGGRLGGAADPLSEEFYRACEAELAHRVGARRLEHIRGVADTAAELARVYGADVRRARLAGLLHDWDKAYDDAGIRARADELGISTDPFVYEAMPRLLHGPTAAAALAREYPEIPDDVICAIDRHTTGAVGMSDLDMIVYIADAIEPGRSYGRLDELRAKVGKAGLEELFLQTFKHIFLMLVDREKTIYPRTDEIWNHYLARRATEKGNRFEQHDR